MNRKVVSVIILTFNEEIHIERCINSLVDFATEIFVVDSFSTDNTIEIAKSLGAKIYQNAWVNQAVQFQWALDHCPIQSEWVMRMDADEYVSSSLQKEIQSNLATSPKEVSGIILKRRVYFMDKWIKHGDFYPTKLLRIWRNRHGRIEQRWMDEHIMLTQGIAIEFKNDIIDNNLNNLSWWTDKHNKYATREAVDILNKKYDLFPIDSFEKKIITKHQHSKKRWLKDNLFLKLPVLFRAFIYFFYRFFIRLGFLDGKEGVIWHLLQGFWYRFLVDSKVYQIERWAKDKGKTIKEVLEEDYDFYI